MDKPEVVGVLENRQRREDIKTLVLDKAIGGRAGQFVMLWMPGVGEKPFTLSRIGKKSEITYDIKGRFTKAMFSLKEGDKVGVRGPYGNGWDLEKAESVCAVAGGIGLAPMMPIIEGEKAKVTVIYGARSADCLVFRKELEKTNTEALFTTDDGSFGKHCYACDALKGVLEGGKHDVVLTCGPELMMRRAVDICLEKKIPCQASLERYMKCGMGVCGSCAIDPSGLLVCKDGPIFTAEQLAGSEFGEYSRTKSGAKRFF